MRSPWQRLFAASLVLALAIPFTCGAIREDEFLCDEAIAHLRDCCPSLAVPSNFCAVQSSCDSPGHSAGLSVAQSRCLLDQSCSTLSAQCATWTGSSDAGGSCL